MSFPAFQHEAMATQFSITIAEHPIEYARQAAAAAWRDLDRLEGELSRYVESSDIARANRTQRGETITIGHDALQCLLIAAELTVATKRTFDVAYASQRGAATPEGSTPFTLDPDGHLLTSHCEHLHLDLGAIGKGYALDRLAEVLGEWGITTACLQSGGSTALALDPPAGSSGWSVGLGDGECYSTVDLTRCALSGSGIAIKGEHLINPLTGKPAIRHRRIWALAPDAAVSDALSTAFFVMPDAAISRFCAEHPTVGAAISVSDEKLIRFGTLAVQ